MSSDVFFKQVIVVAYEKNPRRAGILVISKLSQLLCQIIG